MRLLEGKSEDMSVKININMCPRTHTDAKIRCWTMDQSLRYSHISL